MVSTFIFVCLDSSWDLVDKLVDAGLQRHRNLSVEAMVTLYRMKLRENSDFSHLSVMFGCMDDGELTRVFYEVALLHFESSCTVPRLWTTPNLSYDEINAFFDEGWCVSHCQSALMVCVRMLCSVGGGTVGA